MRLNNKSIDINDSVNIDVLGNSKINIINPDSDIKLNIHLKDNSNLIINDFNETKNDIDYNIIQDNNSIFNMYHTFRISDNYNINYKVNFLGNNNINNVYIHGVSNGMVSMNVDGILPSGGENNIVNEDIKVLTIHGSCFISPMLHVSNLNVIANHKTAISKIDENIIFYLESKGINRASAEELIENGYLYGIYEDKEFIKRIRSDINE